MDSLDKEIMMALVASQQSMYGLQRYLKKNAVKSNYTTVWRHIKRMQKEGLVSAAPVSTKNGKHDKRGTEKPELTTRGLATLLIEGDPKKEELQALSRKTFDSISVSRELFEETRIEEIFADTLLKVKYKVNLKFFDELYFNQIFSISLLESIFEQREKIHFKENSRAKDDALKLKKKYVVSEQVEPFKKFRQLFIQERDKFNHYVTIIDNFLKALGN
jgi:hypothetical protein